MTLILPPLRRTAQDAARFATIVHDGQVDKAGRPYVEHLSRVAAGALKLVDGCPFWSDQERDEAVQIAWLHDTVEDTHIGLDDLGAEGFTEFVRAGVAHLTKEPRLAGRDYMQRLVMRGTLPALLVKLADVTDNSDPKRLARLPEADRARLTRKYHGASDRLREAARAKGWQGP